MTAAADPSLQGFRFLGAYKLASGLLLIAAGFGVFRLVHHDLGAEFERLVIRLRLDPEHRLIHLVAVRVAGLDEHRLRALGAGTFAYAGLRLAEGFGLFFRRRWGAWLTVIASGLLLPVEVFEIARQPTALRIAVLLVNVVVVVYLAVKLRQGRQQGAE